MLLFIAIFTIFAVAYTGFSVSKSSNKTTKMEVEGLYHFTSLETAQKIVKDGNATIWASGPVSSISNGFKKSTFYFCGVPTYLTYVTNFGKLFVPKELYAIKIDVSQLPAEVRNKMKTRLYDDVVFHSGDLTKVPAQIVKVDRSEVKFAFQPVLFAGLTAVYGFVFGGLGYLVLSAII